MKILNKFVGIIIVLIGIIVAYVDVYIISLFFEISKWLSGLINAPEALSVLLTLILMWMFVGLLFIIAIIGIYLFVIGLILIKHS